MKHISLAVAILALTGCSGGLLAPSTPPPALYTLQAPKAIEASADHANWQLLIALPDAAMDLDVVRIAVVPAPSRLDYYAGVAWADRPAEMLQDLIVESFDRSGRIDTVQRESGGVRGDFILATDLEDFQAEADSAAPVVHVRLAVRLIRTRDRAIVASRTFESKIPVGGDFDAVIAGFNHATQALLPEIVAWTLDQGARNP
jgi:cholesterol transport system auxiliary component